MTKRWVGLASVLVLASGCSSFLKTASSTQTVEVRRFEEPVVSDGWSYDGTVAASTSGADVRIRVKATQYKTCSSSIHRVVRTMETTTRAWDGGPAMAHGALAVAVVVLGAGLVSRYALDNPFRQPELNDVGDTNTTGGDVTTTGWIAIAGGIGTAVLTPAVIGTDVKAIDPAPKDLGEKEELSEGFSHRCQDGPAAGVRVSLGQLADATSDQDGNTELIVSKADLVRAGGEVRVGGAVLESAELGDLRERLAAELSAEAEAARIASIEKTSDAEVASKSCDAGRRQTLEGVVGDVTQTLEKALGFVVVDHVIAVASPTAKPVPFGFVVAGEYHVFALSYSATQLVGGGAESPFGAGFTGMTGARVTSTVVHASPSSAPKLSLSGRGCTLVVNAMKM